MCLYNSLALLFQTPVARLRAQEIKVNGLPTEAQFEHSPPGNIKVFKGGAEIYRTLSFMSPLS